MKLRACFSGIAAALLALAGIPSLNAAPPPATAGKLVRPELPKSVFVLPASPQEGRDPFFPTSMRPYLDNPKNIKPTTTAPTANDLVVKSIYTAEDGRVLALINNHTVAPGDDATITTKDNHRISIHCQAINQVAGTVTIDSNGSTVILTVGKGQ